MAATTLLFSCKKPTNQAESAAQTELSIKASAIVPNLKSTEDWECKDTVPDHAWMNISGTDYYPEVYSVGDGLYTQSIKILEGTNYCMQNFVLYQESGDNAGYQPLEDVTTHGAPITNSDYAPYVLEPLDYCFDVNGFEKVEIPLEVLCFQDAQYQNFGFEWFAITQIAVRQFCFFGDLCISDATLFENDQYYSQGGVQVDEEAVFRVIVKDNGTEVPYSPYSNDTVYGTGSNMCVDYPDNLSVVNNFSFELEVWQPDANGAFLWQAYDTLYSQDDGDLYDNDQYTGTPVVGTDGVVDFAVGSCSPDSYPIYDWIYANSNLISSYGEDSTMKQNGHPTIATWPGQTFTTGNTPKQILSISTKLVGPGNGGLLAYNLYEFDTNTNTIGALVATTNMGGYVFGTFPVGLVNTRYFNNVTLNANTTYAFVFINGGSNFFEVMGSASAPYPGGTAFYSNNPVTYNYNPENFDLWFEINFQ